MNTAAATPGQGRWRPNGLSWLARLWPQTLSGRIAAILVIGMLAAQAMTGTIWWEMRRSQLLEVPLRLVAARAADTLALLQASPPEQRAALVAQWQGSRYQLQLVDGAGATTAPSPYPEAQALVAQVISERLGQPVPLQLQQLALLGERHADGRRHPVLLADQPEAHLRLLLQMQDGQWLQIDAQEGEIGQPVQPLQALADYVLRVYLLRSLVIVAVALIAVRLAMRPLQRLAAAAEALGRNLHSPPMDARGPREVQQAAQAFNAMQQKINEGLAERTRFLAAVSHDLRSPITRLRLRAEMLEPDALRAKFRKDLEEMEHMVASTLDMLTGAHASGPRQTMDIHALVHGVAQDMHESSGLPVPVSGRALQPYTGYAQSLRRGLQNLVENALRYAGDAQLHIDDDGQQLRIHVRDHGPGIPAAQRERVLEPYYRMEPSRNAASGGVGLGLSIAQTVAQAHGGELLLREADGGGLEAVLVLPRGAAAESTASAPH
ncbi:ATP-binding protein [Comamonas sp. MYb69]|uniref:ATP-binding protein n=1 Tax=Comamonas sp. MYb69 TaxID=1848650 RepID=UPI00309A9513